MAVAPELVVVDSRYEAPARCLVCGNDIAAGEGVTARYRGQTLRFKCAGCYARFELDPDRYQAGHESGCCMGERGDSPSSEWRCD
jgi:hypothetical protein